MKLNIPFDEIKDAIEQASYEHHYLIDKKNNKIVFISEIEEDYEKKLEEMENDDFIGIEPRRLWRKESLSEILKSLSINTQSLRKDGSSIGIKNWQMKL